MRLARWSLILLLGCGAPSPLPPVGTHPPIMQISPFPSRHAVEELAQAEVKPLPRREVATVSRWRVEAAPDAAPIEGHLPGITFTKELRCIAREYGRLQAEKGAARPDERLERFISEACGASARKTMVASWKLTVPENAPDAKVFAALAATPIPDEMKGKPAGAWLTRSAGQAILTLASAGDEDAVTVSLADSAGRVTVEGTTDARGVWARINVGRDHTAGCEPDPAVKRPAFRFTCTLADADPWAWIQVLEKRHDEHALIRSHALVIARRDSSSALELAASEPSGAAGDPERVILGGVNRARQGAKLAPLALAANQSATNARLAPHFFRAVVDGDTARSEDLAQAGSAGWDVDGGMIRSGHFLGLLLTGANTPESCLDFALETPLGREILLRPDSEQVAIGVAPATSVGGVGVFVTTYHFFEQESRRANEAILYRRVAEARAARKLPAAKLLPEMPLLEQEVALAHAGKRNPQEVLDLVSVHESQRLRRSLVAFLSLNDDLERMAIQQQPEIMAPGPLSLRIAVTTYRPEKSPWGHYLVYVVASAPE